MSVASSGTVPITRSVTARAAAMFGSVGLDRALGEPPAVAHPVAIFGSTMTGLEARLHADTRRAGVAYTSLGVALCAGSALMLRRVLGPVLSTVVVGTLAMAGRMLEEESERVAELLSHGDLDGARERVGSLVGRSTGELEEHEIARAVIESLAENTVDAVTATLWWGTVGGAVGASIHRGINTMDAMVGHRSARYRNFGWASARLDDVVNWIPARLTVLATMGAAPSRARDICRAVSGQAHHHPSPNGGVIEAAFAAALGVRLGGVNRYDGATENRGELGDGPPPTHVDIGRATRLARRVGLIVAGGCVAGSVAARLVSRRVAASATGTRSGLHAASPAVGGTR